MAKQNAKRQDSAAVETAWNEEPISGSIVPDREDDEDEDENKAGRYYGIRSERRRGGDSDRDSDRDSAADGVEGDERSTSATRIQAAFRGFMIREEMEAAHFDNTLDAITRLQAIHRGNLTRSLLYDSDDYEDEEDDEEDEDEEDDDDFDENDMYSDGEEEEESEGEDSD